MSDQKSFIEAFDQVYIINLPSRPDRLRQLGKELRKVGVLLEAPKITVMPAVRPTDAGPFESVGARGCFMSHLSVLEDAISHGYKRFMILEDDVKFTKAFSKRASCALQEMNQKSWCMLYAGHETQHSQTNEELLLPVAHSQAVGLAHAVAFSLEAASEMAAFLRSMLARPAGSPQGGPMHVDGAYSWFRRLHPHRVTLVAEPQIALQRPSQSDISAMTWKDRVPGAKFFRSLKGAALARS